MITFLSVISFGKILEYYGIMCIVMLPVSLLTLIVISKRTNWFEKLDLYLDRKLGVPAEAKTAGQVAENKDAPLPKPTEEETREMSGIAAFSILVGEKYICHLNYQNRGGSTGQMIWYNDNEFVGDIMEDGLFTARKVGVANLFCVSKGHAYDPGIQAYQINVVSRRGRWFADKAIEMVTKRAPKADILAKNIKRKLVRDNPSTKVIQYAGIPSEPAFSLSMQFDELGTLARCVYVLNSNKKLLQETVDCLNERFEEVPLSYSYGYRIWIHQIIDNEHDEVDVYAFLKETDSKELIMGFGQTWREYGEKEEFLDNIRLSVRMFSDLIKGTDADIEAYREPQTGSEDANNEDNDKESPVEQTEKENSTVTQEEEETETPVEGDVDINSIPDYKEEY